MEKESDFLDFTTELPMLKIITSITDRKATGKKLLSICSQNIQIKSQIRSIAKHWPKKCNDPPISEHGFTDKPRVEQWNCLPKKSIPVFKSKDFTLQRTHAFRSKTQDYNFIEKTNIFAFTDFKVEQDPAYEHHH